MIYGKEQDESTGPSAGEAGTIQADPVVRRALPWLLMAGTSGCLYFFENF